MKKIILFVFVLGLIPAFAHSEGGCVCKDGDLACLTGCTSAGADNAWRNLQSDKQKASNAVRANKKALANKTKSRKEEAKAKRNQFKKDAKSRREQAKTKRSQFKQDVKTRREQAQKDAKTKRGEVRNAARSAKEAAKAEKQAWEDLAE